MRTPAKINLYLEVCGKRPDGFHNIRTIFLPVKGLYDTVTVTRTPQPGITIQCPGFPELESENNLCWKAANAFCKHFQIPPHHHIFLEKRIPIAAGLGGGSSDAAATLLELLALENPPTYCGELHTVAAELGSDVPFFLKPAPALGLGRGERLNPVQISAPLHLILVNPGFPVPVSWSYQHAKRPTDLQPPDFALLKETFRCGTEKALSAMVWNDLEFAVFEKFPILQIIRTEMQENGAYCTHISGSGPTLFAIAPADKIQPIRQCLQEKFGDFAWIFDTEGKV